MTMWDLWLEGFREREEAAEIRARVREQVAEDDFQQGKDMARAERDAELDETIDRLFGR